MLNDLLEPVTRVKKQKRRRAEPTSYPPSSLLFFFTLVSGPRRSLRLKLSDTRVYAPRIRAPLSAQMVASLHILPPLSDGCVLQMVAWLQGALKTDAASGEMVSSATGKAAPLEWDFDRTSNGDDTESASDSDCSSRGTSLCALNTSPPRNRFRFIDS